MDCKVVQEQMPEYLARALSPEAQTQVEFHLAVCSACQAELVEWQSLDLELSDPSFGGRFLNDPPPLPANFTDRLIARIESEQPSGVNIVWPWLRQRWSRTQYASAAYAMTASVMIFSASSLVAAWDAGAQQADLWLIQASAWLDGIQLYVGALADQAGEFLSALMHLS